MKDNVYPGLFLAALILVIVSVFFILFYLVVPASVIIGVVVGVGASAIGVSGAGVVDYLVVRKQDGGTEEGNVLRPVSALRPCLEDEYDV